MRRSAIADFAFERAPAKAQKIGIGMAETTEKPGEKKLSVSSSKTLSLKARRRAGRRAPELQPRPHQGGGGREGEAPHRSATGRMRPWPPSAAGAASGLRRRQGRDRRPRRPRLHRPRRPRHRSRRGVVLRTLTEEERNARAHALADARVREAEERRIAEEEARVREARDALERVEREAAEARKADEEKRRKHDEETKAQGRAGGEEALRRGGVQDQADRTAGRPGRRPNEAEEEEAPRPRRGAGGAARPAAGTEAGTPRREKRRGRLTLVTALNADEERERSVASFRRRVQRMKRPRAPTSRRRRSSARSSFRRRSPSRSSPTAWPSARST